MTPHQEDIGEGGKIVWQGESLRAVLFDGELSKLILTFDHFDLRKKGFPPCASSKLFRDQGFANLRIQSLANDWYNNADLPELEAHLPVVVSSYVFRTALGFSMGGYAAFRLSSAASLDYIVAISPQFSLARRDAPYEWRWKEARAKFDRQRGALQPYSRSDLSGFILFDPVIRADRLHAARLQRAFPALDKIPLPFAGHPASPLLAEIGLQSEMRAAALDPDYSPWQLHAAYRLGRRRALRYWQNRASRTAERFPDASLAAKGAISALSAIKKR